MNSALFRNFLFNARLRAVATSRNSSKPISRKFSGGHSPHTDPIVPEVHDRIGRGLLFATFMWIFFRAREDNGKLFGLNLPWNEPHDDHSHPSYEYADGDEFGEKMPVLKAEEEHDEEDEEEEEEE
jgi:hypothetical protein